MKIHFRILGIIGVVALCGCEAKDQSSLSTKGNESAAVLMDGINPNISANEFRDLCNTLIDRASSQFEALEKDTSEATMDSVFGRFDSIRIGLQPIEHSWFIKEVHPDEAVREAATDCTIEYSDLFSRVAMSRGLYDRVAMIDTAELVNPEKKIVEDTLIDFRTAGVDKTPLVREKIRALRKEISELGNIFNQNIREDTRYVDVKYSELKGLPEDYLAKKKEQLGEGELVRITTDYPDMGPVMKYAESDSLRKNLRIAARSRGYPKNNTVLKDILIKRYELAQLLGFDNWASLSMKQKMIGTPEKAQSFLQKVGQALKQPVDQEKAIQLKRLKKMNPEAEQVEIWQASYIDNLLVKEDYGLDAKEVRRYFQYDKVRDGIFKLTEDLFSVEIHPWQTATWHPEVETYEIRENDQVIGRFYMDNHPRENKFKHAAHWSLRDGLENRQIPLSALAQNFPKGLMEHGQVETFFHEFGHLLHSIFSGKQKWLAVSGMSMESDFVEAPSQLLEEWVWDYDTLKTFATNEEGKVIPKPLVEKMNKARHFGRAIDTATQIYYANLSLNFYSRDPNSFDLMTLMKELSDQYNPYPFVEGTALFANFGHLYGYSSNYYTYQWSLAIATDMFSKFKQNGMRNKDVSKAYRDKVLSVGGSKPAAEFVRDFLGREFSESAYIESFK